MKTKDRRVFIFVTGGVISGLGKGIITASTSLLLKSAGYKVSALKADMYLNVDAGTMNPLEHGEVFVTEDGLETDQDLGHYERFLNQNLSRNSYFTMGQVYYDVIMRERSLEFEGKCVEGNVHIPQEIIKKIKAAAKNTDSEILFIEVGGTVGEYQNVMFFEAIRRMKQEDPNNVFLVHLVYLVVPGFLGEMKSKPAQASIYELYKLGLQPNFVVCRSETEIDDKRKNTIAFNTGVKKENIISAPDVNSIYKIPLVLKQQDMDKKLLAEIGLGKSRKEDLIEWKDLCKTIDKKKPAVKIAIAGKYFTSGKFALEDSYVCVIEAIKHAAWSLGKEPIIKWFDVERFEKPEEAKKLEQELMEFGGIIVPQGWGSRGVEGKIKCVQFARENKIPYLGLCFGMQMAVIEFARNVLGYKDANSEEANPKTAHPVIHIMPHQKDYLAKKKYGGTIRLGSWPCKLRKDTIVYNAYARQDPHRLEKGLVMERHRHRFELNNNYRQSLESAGLIISGTSPDDVLCETVELAKEVHPFFVGTQFHPEYKSRPMDPHPLFIEFINSF